MTLLVPDFVRASAVKEFLPSPYKLIFSCGAFLVNKPRENVLVGSGRLDLFSPPHEGPPSLLRDLGLKPFPSAASLNPSLHECRSPCAPDSIAMPEFPPSPFFLPTLLQCCGFSRDDSFLPYPSFGLWQHPSLCGFRALPAWAFLTVLIVHFHPFPFLPLVLSPERLDESSYGPPNVSLSRFPFPPSSVLLLAPPFLSLRSTETPIILPKLSHSYPFAPSIQFLDFRPFSLPRVSTP